MPRIWLDYCQFLIDQCFVTRTRHAFDRALRALPITQHSRIWPKYLAFVNKHDIPETAVRVYRRYLKVSVTFYLLNCNLQPFCYYFIFAIHKGTLICMLPV